MSRERQLADHVRSWLREDAHEDADRVLFAVLDELHTTPQRHARWLARRFPIMRSTTLRYGMVAAVAVLLAFIGWRYIPLGADGGTPTATASPTPTLTPTQTATASPTPAPAAAAFPPEGELAIGRHSMTLAGVALSMDFPSAGWISNGAWGIDKGDLQAPPSDSASFILWPDAAPTNVYSDPCGVIPRSPPVGQSAAELAAAVAEVPGLALVSGPTAVTVGGQPAQHVVLTVPDTIGCAPDHFWLWYSGNPNGDNARYASAIGETLHVWIIEVNGGIVWIDAETWATSGPEAAQEVQQIVDSIQFE